MEKLNGKILIFLSFLPLIVYPISVYGAIAFALTILLVAIFVNKDMITTDRIVQNTTILGFTVIFRAIASFFLQILDCFGQLSANYYQSGFRTFLIGFDNVIDAICLIFILAFTILAIISFVFKKDIPFFGWISKKILSTNGARKANFDDEDNE